jgi:hypothetical protein
MTLTYRKVGGLHFVRCGRYGFTFFRSKTVKPFCKLQDARQLTERLSENQPLPPSLRQNDAIKPGLPASEQAACFLAVARALQPAPSYRYSRRLARMQRAISF